VSNLYQCIKDLSAYAEDCSAHLSTSSEKFNESIRIGLTHRTGVVFCGCWE